MNSTPISAWIHAFRLRTLPLSLAGIFLGSFLAAASGHFQWPILLLATTTTLLLQILSNLANDYGDSAHGADNENRIGPSRAIQSGAIRPWQMQKMMIYITLFTLISGGLLIFFGTQNQGVLTALLFFLAGILAIVAALKYTIGKKPYGYVGLGDLFVFLFFGITSVCGVYILHTGHFHLNILLPAASVGLFSSAVLNINNMRDYENDERVKKITLVVRIGLKSAKFYHFFLILTAFALSLLFLRTTTASVYQWVFIISLLPASLHLQRISKINQARKFDPELKKLALITLLFSIMLGIGLIL